MKILRWPLAFALLLFGRFGKWFIALGTLFFGRWARRRRRGKGGSAPERERIVAAGTPERRAENAVLVLLALAVLAAAGFVVVYAAYPSRSMPNELLGLCLGLCLAFIGGAFTVVARWLVVTEEIEDEYPKEHPEEQSDIAAIVHESGSRFTRKRLLIGAGATAGGALGVAALTPALSLGPLWYTAPLDRTPWRRGVALVDENDNPMLASDIQVSSFYSAFAQGADKEDIGSNLVVVRLDPAKLKLPPGRANWAPQGILAFSKICTHAGCAIGLYRKPKFPPLEPNSALVCPCHYSTFNPYEGGKVIYGPAGRPLPQLPLMIDGTGHLRAAGNFSARIGPGWWNVLEKPTTGSE
jgi:ubiquinol-cytochrome c reductase iron-sulfur subunit